MKLILKKKYNIIIAVIVTIILFMGKIGGYGDYSLILPTMIGSVALGVEIVRRKETIKISHTDVALAIFGAYVIAIDISSASMTAGRCMQYMMTALAYMLVRLYSDRVTKVVLTGIVACGVVQSTMAWMQVAGVMASNHIHFACTGSFGNPAMLGCLVAVSVCIAMKEALKATRRERVVWMLSIAYMMPIMVLADSRAAWVACGAGMALMLMPLWKVRTRWKVLTVGAVVMLVVVPLYKHKPVSADARTLIWKVCGIMAKENPVTGLGSDAVRREYMHYQARYFADGGSERERLITANNNYAFNEVLDVMCSYGVIGVVLWLGVVIAFFACNGVRSGQSVGVATVLMFGMFSYPFSNIEITGITALMLGMGKGESLRAVPSRWSKCVALVTVMAMTGVTMVKCAKGKRYDDAMKEYCWDKDEREYVLEHFEEIKNDAVLVSRCGRLLYETGEYERAITVLEQMSRLQASPELYYDLGKCYEKTNDGANAERCYNVVTNMLPAYMTPQYKLMRMYEKQGEIEKAKEKARYMLAMPLKMETSESKRMKNEAKKIVNRR